MKITSSPKKKDRSLNRVLSIQLMLTFVEATIGAVSTVIQFDQCNCIVIYVL